MIRTAAIQNFGHPELRLSGVAAKGFFSTSLPLAEGPDSRHSGQPPFRIAAVYLLLILGASLLSGCAGVKPWERDILSRPAMQIDPNPMISGCDNHIYFSREASKGGNGFGGGGCGCN